MRITQFSLEYDTHYGIENRSGWSISVNGSVAAEFKDTPHEALLEAFASVADWEPEDDQ